MKDEILNLIKEFDDLSLNNHIMHDLNFDFELITCENEEDYLILKKKVEKALKEIKFYLK